MPKNLINFRTVHATNMIPKIFFKLFVKRFWIFGFGIYLLSSFKRSLIELNIKNKLNHFKLCGVTRLFHNASNSSISEMSLLSYLCCDSKEQWVHKKFDKLQSSDSSRVSTICNYLLIVYKDLVTLISSKSVDSSEWRDERKTGQTISLLAFRTKFSWHD